MVSVAAEEVTEHKHEPGLALSNSIHCTAISSGLPWFCNRYVRRVLGNR